MDIAEYEHRCKFIPSQDIHIYRSESVLHSEVWDWFLVIQRCADESDLEKNHYLDEIGDLIWQTVVGISYCPYCGDALESAKCHDTSRDAEFRLVDSSGWSSRTL